MTPERYQFLMDAAAAGRDADTKLSEEEVAAGWHYCYDWDFLLIGPGMDEMESCLCQS